MTTTAEKIVKAIKSLNWKELSDDDFNTVKTAFELKYAELKWDSNRRQQAKNTFPSKK